MIHVFCVGQAYKEGYEPVEEELQVVDGQATDLKITLMRTVRHALHLGSSMCSQFHLPFIAFQMDSRNELGAAPAASSNHFNPAGSHSKYNTIANKQVTAF